MNWKSFLCLLITPFCTLAQWTELPFPTTSTFYQETKAYVQDSFLFVYTDGVLHRTSDNGDTWTDLTDGMPKGQYIGALVHSGEYLIASMVYPTPEFPPGIYHSTNNGNTWDKLVDSLKDIRTAHLLQRNGDLLFAYGSQAGEQGIHRSDDRGKSWNFISRPTNAVVLGFAATKSHMYVATYDGGIFSSSDSGQTWIGRLVPQFCYAVIANDEYAYTSSTSLYRSDNYGYSWQQLNTPISSSIGLTMKNNLIFGGSKGSIGVNGKVYYSIDNGDQWTEITGNLNDNYIYFLTVCGNYLFAGTSSGVWRYSLEQLSVATREKATSTLLIRTDKKNSISVRFALPPLEESIRFEIYDLLGRLVATETFEGLREGSTDLTLSINLPAGAFLCKMIGNTHIEAKTFIVLP